MSGDTLGGVAVEPVAVADELAVGRAQVYAMVRDKTLLALKVGGRGKWRVERSELEAYIARLYQEARARPAVDADEDDDEVLVGQ